MTMTMTMTTLPAPEAATTARSLALLGALVGALAWNVLQVDASTGDDALVAPPLTLPEPRCGVGSTDPEELLAHGARLAGAARARIDRYPFRAAEGLPALALLGEASACAAQAGADAEAAALGALALRFRQRLEADNRDRVLRVERALADDEPRRVRPEIDALAAQFEGEDHLFARRMRNLRAALTDDERR